MSKVNAGNRNKDEINFKIKEHNGKPAYQEAIISHTDSKKAYLQLIDLFFRPMETLKEDFNHIFPKEIKYSAHHQMLLENEDFRPWNGWVFRGHKNASYNLSTTLERLLLNKEKDFGENRDIFEIEQGIIRNFRRTAGAFYPYINTIPENDIYQFMAHLQHFGGATRFLDVTYSFFVALFFAINDIEIELQEKGVKKKKRAFSIWCFDRAWIEKRYKEYLPWEVLQLYRNDTFGKNVETQTKLLNYVPILKKDKLPYQNECLAVINMNPFYLNTRLSKQKGLFLFPINPYRSFEDNLFNMVRNEEETWHILKITVQYDNNMIIHFRKLLDSMNINNFVLFEDLNGFCKDINSKVYFHDDSITTPPRGGNRS